jgi:hypothetical protein
MNRSPKELLASVRQALAPTEGTNHFVELISDGSLPVDRVKALLCEEYLIGNADRRSFSLLAARFPDSPAADFFLYLASSETPGRIGLLNLAAKLGLEEKEIQAYEPLPGCQMYPAYLSLLALGSSQVDSALAIVANMATFADACAATAKALQRHYGVDRESVGFFAVFGEPNPEFEALAMSVVESGLGGDELPRSARTAARLLQTYELAFWNTLAETAD